MISREIIEMWCLYNASRDQVFGVAAVRIIHRNDAAEEMALTTATYNFDEVVEQLLAVLHLPVVVTLVNGNNKPLLRSIHIFY